MKRLDIAILGYNRPKFLYVTLSALFKVREIEDHRVWVFLDGGAMKDKLWQNKMMMVNFPLYASFERRKNVGLFRQYMFAYWKMFDDGAEEVIVLEDDHIMTPDCLEYVKTAPRDSFFLSLCGSEPVRLVEYRPMGNLLTRADYQLLNAWVMDEKYYGLPRPGFEEREIIPADPRSNDAVMYAFLKNTGFHTQFPAIPYTATFGVTGMNTGNPDEVSLELHRRMFTHWNKDVWLGSVIDILESGEVTDRPGQISPQNFQYRGR